MCYTLHKGIHELEKQEPIVILLVTQKQEVFHINEIKLKQEL